MIEAILSFLPRAIAQGTPLLFGSTGEIITQKSGNMNLGIPGVMYVGGICGVIGAFVYEQTLPSPDAINPLLAVLIPTAFCLIGSLLMGLLFCFLTVTLRANQNVTGLAMTTFGVGFGNFFGGSLVKLSGPICPFWHFPTPQTALRKPFPLPTSWVSSEIFSSATASLYIWQLPLHSSLLTSSSVPVPVCTCAL